MENKVSKRFSKFLIILAILILLFGVWVYLFLIGLPSYQTPTIPPKRGLVKLKKIEPNDDVQSILNYKLIDNGNAADYYVKAVQSFDSSIFLNTHFYGLWGAEYNPNYRGIDLIVNGAKYKNCTFPTDVYYSANTVRWPYEPWLHLLEATFTKGTILQAQGKPDEAAQYFEAGIVFGKHIENARLSYFDTEQSVVCVSNSGRYLEKKYSINGMESLINYYKMKGDDKKVQKCQDFLTAETTFRASYYSLETGIFFATGRWYSTPFIRYIPTIVMVESPSSSIDPVIECALYHEDRTCRIEAIEYLGICRTMIIQHIMGLPIMDNAKEKQVEFVLQYIKNNDPDPLLRLMATKALVPHSVFNRFMIFR